MIRTKERDILKPNANLTGIFITCLVLISSPVAFGQGQLLGTYYVSYKYNCAGCSANSPSNPYYCISVPPGPIRLSLQPGDYNVKVIGFGPEGPNGFFIWLGSASSGNYVLVPSTIGNVIPFTVAAGEEVSFYIEDPFAGDNPDQGCKVELYSQNPNQPPDANNDSYTTDQDTPVNITLFAIDPETDPLTYSIDPPNTPPVHGTLTGTPPNLIYTPAQGYTGNDSFTFTANDGQDDSNPATVSITVLATGPKILSAEIRQVGSPPLEMGDSYSVRVIVQEDNAADPLAIFVVRSGEAPNFVTQAFGDSEWGDAIVTEEIPPGQPATFDLPFISPAPFYKHKWNWMGELNNGCFGTLEGITTGVGVGSEVAKLYQIFRQLFGQVISGILAVNDFAGALVNTYAALNFVIPKADYHYNITASDQFGTTSTTLDISLVVPSYKLQALLTYIETPVVAAIASGLDAAWFIVTPIAIAASCGFYSIATDPDPNFTTIATTEPINIPELDSLPASTTKQLGQAWLQVVVYQRVVAACLGKYEGARDAGDKTWMIKQLEAAKGFHAAMMSGLDDVRTSTAALIGETKAEGFTLTQGDLDAATAQLQNSGFPPAVHNILSEFGFGDTEITEAAQAISGIMHLLPLTWQEQMTGVVAGITNASDGIGGWIDDRLKGLQQIKTLSPICNCGGPYVSECTGTLMTVHLDATGSSDPDGGQLTYLWSTDCPFASFDNPASPTAALSFNSAQAPGNCSVTLTVRNRAGWSSNCTTGITVKDIQPPVVEIITATPNVLTPADHKMVSVTLNVTASDTCGSTTSRIVAVTSNEPVNGLENGDQSSDWEITGDLTVNLRAERSGTGTGRVYTITVETSDNSGNKTQSTVNVTVPHNSGLRGDLNSDGSVDRNDLNILMTQIRAHSTDLTYDLNGDGKVDIADARWLVLHYSNPDGSPAKPQ